MKHHPINPSKKIWVCADCDTPLPINGTSETPCPVCGEETPAKAVGKWRYSMRRWTFRLDERIYVYGEEGRGFNVHAPNMKHDIHCGNTLAAKRQAMIIGERAYRTLNGLTKTPHEVSAHA